MHVVLRRYAAHSSTRSAYTTKPRAVSAHVGARARSRDTFNPGFQPAAAFALYPFAHSFWSMAACAIPLGLALGCSHPMVMTTLHQITPESRHGEAIALRSMTISISSALMPLALGAVAAAVGATGLFWSTAYLVGRGSWVARRIELARPTRLEPAE